METFTEDMFEFRKARIVGGDEGAGIGVMGGLRGLDGMRGEGTSHCLMRVQTPFPNSLLPNLTIFTPPSPATTRVSMTPS